MKLRWSARADGAAEKSPSRNARAAQPHLRGILILILSCSTIDSALDPRSSSGSGCGRPRAQTRARPGSATRRRSRRAPGRLPGPAVHAQPVQLQLVSRDREAVLMRHLILELLDPLVLELDDGVAGGADEGIGVVGVGGGLVPGLAVVEVARAGEPGVGEDLHGPVDGRGADVSVAARNLGEKLVDAEVAGRIEESVDDEIARARRLEASLGDPAPQPFTGSGAGGHGPAGRAAGGPGAGRAMHARGRAPALLVSRGGFHGLRPFPGARAPRN